MLPLNEEHDERCVHNSSCWSGNLPTIKCVRVISQDHGGVCYMVYTQSGSRDSDKDSQTGLKHLFLPPSHLCAHTCSSCTTVAALGELWRW